MSNIPFNYRKYIDDVEKLNNKGHVEVGDQIASPNSAGSRGLARTTDFTNNPNEIMKANMTESFSFEDMRTIMNRMDGVNVPVQEAPKQSDIDYTKRLMENRFKAQGVDIQKLGKFSLNKVNLGYGQGRMYRKRLGFWVGD